MELYHLHPIAVHFPIALLLAGLAFEGATIGIKKEWLSLAASTLLLLGTGGAAVAVGLGLLAERTAPHVPAAWEVFSDHKTLGFWTLGLFVALSLWRYFLGYRWRWYFLALWVVAAGVIIATGFHGGELVFKFGVGYKR